MGLALRKPPCIRRLIDIACGHSIAAASDTNGVSLNRRYHMSEQIYFSPIDVVSQAPNLIGFRVFVYINVPSLWTAIVA
jgi:hypothetical protein